MNILLLAATLVGVTLASYDPYVDMAQLYRMQLLANAFDDYLPESQLLDSRSEEPYWPELEDVAEPQDDKDAIYNDRFYSGAHLRDQEHLEHSALHGYQSVSGGASEVPPNPKQVKSDKQLPEYCNPPNPCPVGKTAKDNCVENFDNSAENNERLLSQQDCPCDTEHMFSCPAGSQTVSSKAQSSGNQQMALNKVMDEIAKMEHDGESLENNPTMSETRKRVTLVAKKSPHIIHKRSEQSDHSNPFLQGAPVAIAAKKDPNTAQRVIPQWARYDQPLR
ncbi:7B2 precursor [Aplysia californica]|uniref:Neuroendocrine protein 7B2 n=1 Tax=Aplysia californica TaxID=6500 RepID=A5GZV0_APLCA|nr:7B2 precursor [Aplysia californica]ABF21075.1 7B2 [Aplysia californica]